MTRALVSVFAAIATAAVACAQSPPAGVLSTGSRPGVGSPVQFRYTLEAP